MDNRGRECRPGGKNLDLDRQMIEETHAVEITHRAGLAFLEIQADTARGRSAQRRFEFRSVYPLGREVNDARHVKTPKESARNVWTVE